MINNNFRISRVSVYLDEDRNPWFDLGDLCRKLELHRPLIGSLSKISPKLYVCHNIVNDIKKPRQTNGGSVIYEHVKCDGGDDCARNRHNDGTYVSLDGVDALVCPNNKDKRDNIVSLLAEIISKLNNQITRPIPNIIVEERKIGKCVICRDSTSDHVILECGHLCLCGECEVKLSLLKCPCCRQKVSKIVKVYTV